MKRLLVVSAACLLSAVTVAVWLGVHGAAGTIAFAIIYGLISGGLVSLPPVTVAGLSKDQDEYSTRMGMAFTVCSFGALVGNPIAGALLTTVRKNRSLQPFLGAWLFAAGTMALAGALSIWANYLHHKADERGGKSDFSDESGGKSDFIDDAKRRSNSRRLRSLASEALTMQGVAGGAFAL
jgi:MFS family permease